MQYRQLFFYLFILLAVFPGTSFAAPVDYVYDNSGAVWYTDGISDVGTYGDDMEGMGVTVTFSDGSTEFVTWDNTGADSGAATGTGWSLAVTDGSTYLNVASFEAWIFTVNTAETVYDGLSVTQLFIDAGAGDAVFDTVLPNTEPSTDGSYSGNPFVYTTVVKDETTGASSWEATSDSWGTTATYSGLVALTGQEAVGDLYRYLTIDFGTPVVSGTTIYFGADTDNVEPVLVVPEPTTIVLFGIGLAGLAGVASRKRRT